MTNHNWLARLGAHERINFLLTNRIPRRLTTQIVARISRSENPIVRRAAFALWQRFGGDLGLEEAERCEYASVHECFTRRLKPGARPLDRASRAVSPCDAIVGAHGRVAGVEVFQAKGFPYTLPDLLSDPNLATKYANGVFATLRLKSNFYHRFHAPCDARIREVRYISGDTWNVNPIALRRIERLFCKNERAVIELELHEPGRSLLLVPVAAILVASIRLHFLAEPLCLRYQGPHRISCNRNVTRGEELGYFEHGSTIIVLATPKFALHPSVAEGVTLRMGQPLLVDA